MRRGLLLVLLVLSALVLVSPLTMPNTAAQRLAQIYVDPPFRDVLVSTTFTVDVKIADVANLMSWQVNITFNPALLECKGASEGPFLAGGGTTDFLTNLDNAAGRILIGCLLNPTTQPPVSGSGTLASVKFHCKGVGRSDLVFSLPQTLLLAPPAAEPTEISYQAIDGIVSQYSPAPVGGLVLPTNKLAILTPYLALAGLVAVMSTVVIARKKRQA